jgi:hypothetical protein
MKALNVIIAAMALASSSLAMAEGGADRVFGKAMQNNAKSMQEYALTQGKAAPEVTHYKYGMQLDIAEVIYITPADGSCGVRPVQMTYKDSSGALHTLEYRALSSSCSNGG